MSQSTFFQSCREGLPGLSQYKVEDKVSCSRVECSAPRGGGGGGEGGTLDIFIRI